jgi:hypothetical protein
MAFSDTESKYKKLILLLKFQFGITSLLSPPTLNYIMQNAINANEKFFGKYSVKLLTHLNKKFYLMNLIDLYVKNFIKYL